MSPTPYVRSVPFGESRLEDIALQYIHSQRQLVITFYYQGVQFACLCSKVDDKLTPLRVVNHLKKDDHDVRARLLASLLNDRLGELFATISNAHPSFRSYVRREIGEVHYA